jgi:hypothetical protein
MQNEFNSIYIDIGSSTVKVYRIGTTRVELITTHNIPFKENFNPHTGIDPAAKADLFRLIKKIKQNSGGFRIKIMATALYRKLDIPARIKFIDEFYQQTGLYFNIISQELESFYLEKALVGKSNLNEPVLLINIGGGSTELIVMYGMEAVERHNLDIGVGTLLKELAGINNSISQVPLKKAIEFVTGYLPKVTNKPKIAFYSGGELNYMQLAAYPLQSNVLFKDVDHPSLIDSAEFGAFNQKIFNEVKLEDLQALMPSDPNWMKGARPCSAFAQAVVQAYGIQTIIPSDSNTIHGMIRQEFRNVTISGSFRKHLDYILKIKDQLASDGTIVLSPRFTKPNNPGEEFVVFTGEEGASPLQLERHHLDSIDSSDALIVCDPNGYVGASALIEIGYATSMGKRIIFTEQPEEFMLNTLPREVGL